MSHLNIYVSRERDTWLRKHLEALAQQDNRSLSYIIEEALVEFVQKRGLKIPSGPRKDHRSRGRG